MYTVEYTTIEERDTAISEAAAIGFVMLHDDFGAPNILTFAEPIPPTDGELAVIAIEQETAEANDQALVAYQNFDTLTLAQKNKVLKGLLGDFISRNRGNYI